MSVASYFSSLSLVRLLNNMPGGIATLSINYYDLGVTTGKMAAKILNGESKIAEMPIEYFQNPVKKFNPAVCDLLGISVPDDYEAIG